MTFDDSVLDDASKADDDYEFLKNVDHYLFDEKQMKYFDDCHIEICRTIILKQIRKRKASGRAKQW